MEARTQRRDEAATTPLLKLPSVWHGTRQRNPYPPMVQPSHYKEDAHRQT